MVNGASFESVRNAVTVEHDRMLPDTIVHLSQLRMNDEGLLQGPGTPTFRLNPWARKQLASDLGLRWETWFEAATPTEAAAELNRRLSRMPGTRKIRAWRDPEGKADGLARAVLSGSFTPIDDVRIFDRLAATMRGVLNEYVFIRVDRTDITTHYTAAHVDGMDLDGDVIHPGWNLKNSEVGGSSLCLDVYFLRKVCSNGLLLPVNGRRLLLRTHRHIDDDHLAAAMVIALGKLPDQWTSSLDLMRKAKQSLVPHPDAAVAAALDSPEIPRALVHEAQAIALRDTDRSRWSVANAITLVAHQTNRDPDVRYRMESRAGEYLAAA